MIFMTEASVGLEPTCEMLDYETSAVAAVPRSHAVTYMVPANRIELLPIRCRRIVLPLNYAGKFGESGRT